ncbi:UDP-N-acetylmuramoylalanine--D-glutamate ligase [Parelusimicrobium proximum]|uniref:UDP-N-acetylmuramoyl-L-alanine--D-glutamate ligase n=1 Tax=Parelusimicrobium proximum TaxID=3228953 RepID=UPI003D17EC28
MFDVKKFKGKKGAVLGFGLTGLAAAEMLHDKKFKLLVSDDKYRGMPLKEYPFSIELGEHTDEIMRCGFVVKSPGISPKAPILKKIRNKKIPVFSEMEVALSFLPRDCKVFAVTGTNGKTTTTLLLSKILQEYAKKEGLGRKIFTLGNIGSPVSAEIKNIKRGDWLVIEVSSYQLEDSTYFKPDTAIVLNVTPDHIDHHGSFKKYAEAKAKIFNFQTKGDVAIINAGDSYCAKMIKKIKAKVLSFATTPDKEVRSHVFFDGDEMVFSTGERIRPPALPGVHNVENAMAAALAALQAGVKSAVISAAFKKFKGVEHRLEPVLEYKGIKCINDSKATNIDSTIVALKALDTDRKIWLILGGTDKGSPYDVLVPHLIKYCKQVLTIGAAAGKIKTDIGDMFPVRHCGDIETAVKYALKKGVKGDVLLLSPACASFDQFKNYEERGKYFKKICRKTAAKK